MRVSKMILKKLLLLLLLFLLLLRYRNLKMILLEWARKKISFGTIQIREHALACGDNPSVSYGTPISLDWLSRNQNNQTRTKTREVSVQVTIHVHAYRHTYLFTPPIHARKSNLTATSNTKEKVEFDRILCFVLSFTRSITEISNNLFVSLYNFTCYISIH